MLIAQLWLTLLDPMDCNLPGSSVHGILQARILEWATIPFSKETSWPKDQAQVSYIADGLFTIWATSLYPQKTTILKDTCTPVFILALFTIARTCKWSRYQSTDEWIKKLWYICSGMLFSHWKEWIWVDSSEVDELEIVTQSEVSQRKSNIVY